MSRKHKIEDVEKLSILESTLYEKVENFFIKEKSCKKTGSAVHGPISLSVFGGTIYPDVFGVSNPSAKDFQIYMAEGKLSFRGRNFDICKGQAISLQRFSDYVYIFFPKVSWNEIDAEEKLAVEEECESLKLGLLIVDKDACQVHIKPSPNQDLLKKDNRLFVKNKIVQYFPNYTVPEENAEFFKSYVKLANNMLEESYSLVYDYLVSSFIKISPVKKQSIKHWYYNSDEDTFQFFLSSKLNKSEVFLIMHPFGSEVFDFNYPTLLIQHRFKGSMIKKHSIQKKISGYIDDCLKRNCKLETGDYVFYSPDTSKNVLDYIKDTNPEHFSVFEHIDILGVDKEQVKENAEKILQKIVDFSNSL